MAFIKRYPMLTLVLALCVVAFGAEAFFLLHFRGQANQADSKLAAAQRNLQNAMGVPIAPTDQNRASAQANLDELQQQLKDIGDTLQKTSKAIPAPPSGDNAGTELLADINAYMQNDMLPLAKQKGVLLPTDNTDFSFGLKQYIGQVPPPAADKIPVVFKQMKILDYLLTTLMTDAKQPNQKLMLLSVYREDVSANTTTTSSSGQDTPPPNAKNETFTVPSLVSARKPGFVDTLGFQITFVGYTDSLRLLLNKLGDFELPLVVRSIEVSLPPDDVLKDINAADAATAATAAAAAAAAAGTAGTAGSAKPAGRAPAAKTAASADTSGGDPVIKQNLSQFTITIEYIQLQLPKTAEEIAAEKAAEEKAAAAKAAGTAGTAGTAPAADTASTAGTAPAAASAAGTAPAADTAAKPDQSTSAPKP